MVNTVFPSPAFLRSAAICLLMAVVFSCSKKDDPMAGGPLVGNWKLSALLIKEDNEPEEDILPFFALFGTCFSDMIFTFQSDGIFSTNNPPSCVTEDTQIEGLSDTTKWEVSGSKLKFTDKDNEVTEFDYAVDGDTFSMSQTIMEPDSDNPSVNITVVTTYKFKKV
ncbi:MAG: lipocalin family protein [Runella zeae]